MTLDAEKCYRAIRARDGRFDGVFFTAVVSTGVYCRPVCPAKATAGVEAVSGNAYYRSVDIEGHHGTNTIYREKQDEETTRRLHSIPHRDNSHRC